MKLKGKRETKAEKLKLEKGGYKKFNSARGITLIALVITIIVLLILAGVSVATLTGDNGVLQKTVEAKDKNKKATIKEQRDLAQIEANMNKEVMEYKGVTIPIGFAPTRIEGEDTIEDGLVIIDGKGNEYVWIPCTLEEYQSTDIKTWTENNSKISGNTDASGNVKAWKDEQAMGATDELDGIGEKSVSEHGGFYVARYEAGIPKEATRIYAENDGDEYKGTQYTAREGYDRETDVEKGARNTTDYAAVSKQGVQAWNYISQRNAKTVAEKMMEDNESVQSYLIDSHAWDTVCKKMIQKVGESIIKNDSKTMGNYYNSTEYLNTDGLYAYHKYDNGWIPATTYSRGVPATKVARIELATGASEKFKVYNIYDLAGNMYEWTTESDGVYAVLRGGNFGSYGSHSAVYRNGDVGVGDSYSAGIGFRSVLYLK